jgi:hypothetical protein
LIAGFPWESWLLLVGSVAIPLAIVIAFSRVHRNERKTRLEGGPTGGGEGPTGGGEGVTGAREGVTGGGEGSTR